MFKKNILLIIFIALIGFLLLMYFYGKSEPNNTENSKKILIRIGDVSLEALVADTEKTRIKGLSGKAKLEDNESMLFVFEEEGYQGFWMKDMNFSIDIAWINKDREIIHIEHSVSPDTFPKVFYPNYKPNTKPSLYVLETNANFFERNNIEIGDRLDFSLK